MGLCTCHCFIVWISGVFNKSILVILGFFFFSQWSKVLSPHWVCLVKETQSWVYIPDCAGGGTFFFCQISRPKEGIPLIFKFFLIRFLVLFCHWVVLLYSLCLQGLCPSLTLSVLYSLGGVLVWVNLSGTLADFLPSHTNLILLY